MSKNARAFLRFCREQGYTDQDLAGPIDPFRAGRGRVEWLEWDDVHRLIDAIPEYRLKMAAAWLFYTGCRVGEAINAQQRDVRLINERGLYQWSIPDTKTHIPRNVWLPDSLASYIEQSRATNNPRADWPILWDCEGRGFSRVENPPLPSPPRPSTPPSTARPHASGSWSRSPPTPPSTPTAPTGLLRQGDTENSMERLSRQVGTSVAVLRKTYVHVQFSDADWEHIRALGARHATNTT